MRVTVKYWGQIKQAAGRASECVEVDEGATVRDLIGKIAAERGEHLRGHLLDAGGAPRASLLCAVGDEQVSWDAPRQLAEGDVVTFLPPIAGGRRGRG